MAWSCPSRRKTTRTVSPGAWRASAFRRSSKLLMLMSPMRTRTSPSRNPARAAPRRGLPAGPPPWAPGRAGPRRRSPLRIDEPWRRGELAEEPHGHDTDPLHARRVDAIRGVTRLVIVVVATRVEEDYGHPRRVEAHVVGGAVRRVAEGEI